MIRTCLLFWLLGCLLAWALHDWAVSATFATPETLTVVVYPLAWSWSLSSSHYYIPSSVHFASSSYCKETKTKTVYNNENDVENPGQISNCFTLTDCFTSKSFLPTFFNQSFFWINFRSLPRIPVFVSCFTGPEASY